MNRKKNSDITYTRVETKLSLLTVDGKLDIKYPSGKTSDWIKAESEQDLSSSKTVGNSSSTATPVASPLICETPIISSKESNVNNNLSLEWRVNLLNTEAVAMQSFMVDQVLILKQSLKDSSLEKSLTDISSEVKILKEVNDILRQQNESLLQEKSSKNTIIQLLIKNHEYLNKSVCYRKIVLDETFKKVPQGPLKRGNNTGTFRINCSNRFEVLSTTEDDDDDGNESKSGKSESTIAEEFSANYDVRNRKKIQKSCISNGKYKNNVLLKKNDTRTDHNRRENIKIVSRHQPTVML